MAEARQSAKPTLWFRIVDGMMRRRADKLCKRLAPLLDATLGSASSTSMSIIDVGCGTGHNACALRAARPDRGIEQCDVSDFQYADPRVQTGRIENNRLPYPDAAADAALLLYVLHYCPDPKALLGEIQRVSPRLILIQSAVTQWQGHAVLCCREWIMGRGGFRIAQRLAGIPGNHEALRPARRYTRETLLAELAATGWQVRHHAYAPWPGCGLSRDVLVLEASPSHG